MTKINFNRRPMPIYAEHRPLYKVAQILIALEVSSRGAKSSLLRLQLLNWAIKEEFRRLVIIKAAETGKLTIDVWGIDPALNAAIQFALAEKLITKKVSHIIATTKGRDFVKEIIKGNEMEEEICFFQSIGKKISETMVSDVVKTWG